MRMERHWARLEMASKVGGEAASGPIRWCPATQALSYLPSKLASSLRTRVQHVSTFGAIHR